MTVAGDLILLSVIFQVTIVIFVEGKNGHVFCVKLSIKHWALAFSSVLCAHKSSFFENISRIIAPNYIPTKTDVLRVRVRTRGVIETQFRVNNSLYR